MSYRATRLRQRLNVHMNVAAIAAECLRKCADDVRLVAPHGRLWHGSDAPTGFPVPYHRG